MADNSKANLESTADALEALMKIRASASPSNAGANRLRSQSAGSNAAIGNQLPESTHDANGTNINQPLLGSNSNHLVRIAPLNVYGNSAGPGVGTTAAPPPASRSRQHQHAQNLNVNVPFTFQMPTASMGQQPRLSQIGQYMNPALSLQSYPHSQGMTSVPGHAQVFPSSSSIDTTHILPAPSLTTSIISSTSAAASGKNSKQKQETRSKKNEAAVRTDEVERALKSKPQRGKKRNNLNNDERKELTRTRNRMHAKTTRQRKKARHDELVECEKNYHELMVEKELCSSRKNCVVKFTEFCTELINMEQPDPESSSGAEHSTWKSALGQAETSTGPVAGASAVSGNIRSGAEGQSGMDANEQNAIFAPNPSFSFTSTFGSSRPNLDHHGMQEYEQDFAHELREMLTENDNTEGVQFQYKIHNSTSGIAISDNGAAFCSYEIVLVSGKKENEITEDSDKRCISSGLMQVQFVEQTPKIASVSIHTITMEHRDHQEVGGASSPPLGDRDTFPSVVSLDKHHHNDLKNDKGV